MIKVANHNPCFNSLPKQNTRDRASQKKTHFQTFHSKWKFEVESAVFYWKAYSKLPRAVESLKVLFLDTLYIFIINIILAVCLARINVLLYDPPIRKSNCDALVVQTHLEFFDMEGTEHR